MKRPNILILYTDQQRWDTIKANGNNMIRTPNLDGLAAGGTNFDHCFCQNPVCMPSRISCMTGQYCSALKITHMAVTVPENTLTIQKILSRYGYYNGLVGKLHYLPHANRDHRALHPAYDFHHMELSDEPGCYEDAYRAWVRRKAPGELDKISLGLPPASLDWRSCVGFEDGVVHPPRAHGGGVVKKAEPFSADSSLTHAAFVGEQTMEFLEHNQDRPFFCFSGFYSPHTPWVAPKEFLDIYDPQALSVPAYPEEMESRRSVGCCSDEELRSVTQGYYAMISEVDHWVGKILDKLDQLRIADNTIVVFTSDHGEWLGEHLNYGKGFWAPDAVSRVPLIIRVPEKLGGAGGRQVSDIVECVDIVPTLLSLAGIQIPPEVQGDLLSVTLDRTGYSGDGTGLTEHAGWKSLRFNNFRYVLKEDGEERLYDMLTDPKEYVNVAEEEKYGRILSEARKLLLRRMLKIEQPLKKEWTY